MDKETQKKIRRRITIGTLVALAVIIAIMIIGLITKTLSVFAFQVIVVVFLLAYWVVTDILEPRLTRELEEATPAQKTAYWKYMGVDLLGYLGLIYFMSTMGEQGSSSMGIMGVVVYALCMSAKRRYREEFLNPNAGIPDVQEDDEEESPSESQYGSNDSPEEMSGTTDDSDEE